MTYATIKLEAPNLPKELPTDHQALMNVFYDYWQKMAAHVRSLNEAEKARAEASGEDANYTREPRQAEIFAVMPSKVNSAVVLGNFNYQVCNGGFMQWDDNGYSAQFEILKQMFKGAAKLEIESADKVLNLLERFEQAKKEAETPVKYTSYSDYWSDDEGEETFEEEGLPHYGDLDTEYYSIENAEKMMQTMLDRYEEVVSAGMWS